MLWTTLVLAAAAVLAVAAILAGLAEWAARATYVDYERESADDHKR